MLPVFRRVTAEQAASLLDRAPGTIHAWGTRYGVRKVRIGRASYYDFNDLAVIERELRRGHPVPATPEERAAIRPSAPTRKSEASTSLGGGDSGTTKRSGAVR